MAWSAAVKSVGDAVSEVAKTVSAYGPSDEKKAVKAADKAGDNAKKLVKKIYPKIETNKEFNKKIQPLIDEGSIDGVSDRATYNQKRATVIAEAYTQAYNEVMDLYRQRLQNQANSVSSETAQQSLENQLVNNIQGQQANQIMQKSTSGCMGVSLALVTCGSGLIYLLINLI